MTKPIERARKRERERENQEELKELKKPKSDFDFLFGAFVNVALKVHWNVKNKIFSIFGQQKEQQMQHVKTEGSSGMNI